MKKYLLPIALLVAIALIAGCSSEPGPTPLTPQDPQYYARGQELVLGLGACGACHSDSGQAGEPLSGGRWLMDSYGLLQSPNLTTAATGLKGWTSAEIMQAVRGGEDRYGEPLAGAFHQGYQWMSDEDALSIAVYLRLLPPVSREVERRELSWWDRALHSWGGETHRAVAGFVPRLNPRAKIEYGRYLTDHVAACGRCHSSDSSLWSGEGYLRGGVWNDPVRGEVAAPDLTTAGKQVGEWSAEQFVAYLRSSQSGQSCPVGYYAQASEQDLQAIAAYLKSVSGPK